MILSFSIASMVIVYGMAYVFSLELEIQYNVTASDKIGGNGQIDIGIILSNLIDNAIEAELKEEWGRINVQILPCKKMLQIRVANYIGRPVLKDNPWLRTWKKDSQSHGIGTKSVKKMVEKWMEPVCMKRRKTIL